MICQHIVWSVGSFIHSSVRLFVPPWARFPARMRREHSPVGNGWQVGSGAQDRGRGAAPALPPAQRARTLQREPVPPLLGVSGGPPCRWLEGRPDSGEAKPQGLPQGKPLLTISKPAEHRPWGVGLYPESARSRHPPGAPVYPPPSRLGKLRPRGRQPRVRGRRGGLQRPEPQPARPRGAPGSAVPDKGPSLKRLRQSPRFPPRPTGKHRPQQLWLRVARQPGRWPALIVGFLARNMLEQML